MSRLFAWVAFIAVVVALAPASTPAQAQQQTRVALVIGNGAYTDSNLSPLPNPTNDAQDMAAALRALDFTVYDYTNLAADAMFDALERFRIPALTADIALVYYAGHGMRDGDETYLLAAAAAPTRASHLPRHALTLTQVLETLESAPGLKAVILDSCRDVGLVAFLQEQEIRAAPPSGRSTAHVRAAEIGRGWGRPEVSHDTLIAFATASGEVAIDSLGQRNSPFTGALLQRLHDHEEIGFVFRSVRQTVMDATGNRQRPEVMDAIGARKYFLAGRPEGDFDANICNRVRLLPGQHCVIENGLAMVRTLRNSRSFSISSEPLASPPPVAWPEPCNGSPAHGQECVMVNGRPVWRSASLPAAETHAPIAAESGCVDVIELRGAAHLYAKPSIRLCHNRHTYYRLSDYGHDEAIWKPQYTGHFSQETHETCSFTFRDISLSLTFRSIDDYDGENWAKFDITHGGYQCGH